MRLVIALYFILIATCLHARHSLPVQHLNDTTTIKVDSTPPIQFICGGEPSFPGGDAALIQFLQKNLQNPGDLEDISWEKMKVLLKLSIDEDGYIYKVTLVKSCGSKCFDNEALRVVGLLPRFIPPCIGVKCVPSIMMLPIIFAKH